MDENKETVLVIGGGGRVGYPFAQYCSYNGYDVRAYDRDPQAFLRAAKYIEADLPPESERKITCSYDRDTYLDWIMTSKYIVIMIGTPIDAEGNPRVDGLFSIIDDIVEADDKFFEGNGPWPDDQLRNIILRSTVSPGTTKRFSDLLHQRFSNRHFNVSFCPERIAQGNTFKEMPVLPQLVGCVLRDDSAIQFFSKLTDKAIIMSYEAAELGKLMTNMYRYVNFAIANEFYDIARHYDVDYEALRKAVNLDYPRMNLAMAGPAAGPCLFKDGQFLVSHVPYTDLIRTSFTINEGFCHRIASVIFQKVSYTKKIGILGMAFKSNNDDTRFSLSFKLKKILERAGYSVFCYDPLVNPGSLPSDIPSCDCVVLMTPHDVFDQKFYDGFIKDDVLVIDVWKKFPASKDRINGIYIKRKDFL